MKNLFLVTAISASLMACNSDDNQSDSDLTLQGVAGTIELVDLSTNQIAVNGHRYNADNIAYNTTPLALKQLQKDMLVNITTSGQDSTQVRLNPTIVGVVSNVNHTAKTFTINGVALTFAELSDDIDNGDWVMLSSIPAADGGYTVLSVVEFDDVDLIGQAEIEGLISNLTNTEFQLANTITVDYSNAVIEDNETLRNGQWVEVKGTYNNTFNATEIDVEDYDDLGDDSEVEGIITWVANDKTSFELNSRGRFLVNSQTQFADGNQNNLTAGQMVEVNSVKQGDNRLATEIEFDEQDNDDWEQFKFEFDGIVSDITRTAGIVTSFKMNAQTNQVIQADANTVYDKLNQANFVDGIDVEVEGVIIDSDFVAREIELND
ncbi:DUF5666 domain-containing protein [Moritella sp. F3]|uniref:DUF5666 domain-containing protein n=1 Tax=Moritella sp. F3 TaxID=2718882 RepID=UPI0018E16820|nr:DUF5666 domain-containing protein [Moritella sp. F3]GIC77364.1 hypothetical protein FMO001_20910 [Moritella sp. F1]GIC83287.1 hypothetical protein FMO003_35670 [Moritella sp. F3]